MPTIRHDGEIGSSDPLGRGEGGQRRHDEPAVRRLGEVNRRLANLGAVRDELERMLTGCEGGAIAEWRILEVSDDRSPCLAEDDTG